MKIRTLAAACLLCAAAAALGWAQKVGAFAYLEGDVTLVRNSEELEGPQIGQALQNFDMIRTGGDGLAELTVSTPSAPKMTLRISPKTQFSLEITKLGQKQQTTVGLVGGTVSLKVSRLAGSQAVNVKTDAAAMGVRGTDFTVTSPPTGDILITCDEGEVICTDDEGRELTAIPGTVVEKRQEVEGEEQARRFRAVPVAVSDLEAFRTNWNTERIEALRANPLLWIRKFAPVYRRLSRAFDRNYRELMKQQAILNKWQREDRKGGLGSSMEIMREKKDIARYLKALRATQFLFERVYFRLLELKSYHDQGLGRGTIEADDTGAAETTDIFFKRFERERREMARKMAVVRWVTRMYALRNDGSVPFEAFDEGFQGEEEIFDD
jgi:hypothetical protein